MAIDDDHLEDFVWGVDLCPQCEENVAEIQCHSCGEMNTISCIQCFQDHSWFGEGVLGFVHEDDPKQEKMDLCGLCKPDIERDYEYLSKRAKFMSQRLEEKLHLSWFKPWMDAINGRMVQSYKPIVCLAIFELANSSSRHIPKVKFVERIAEFFFELEIQFGLKHGPRPNVIHSIVLDCIDSSKRKDKWRYVRPQLDEQKIDLIWDKLCEMPLAKLHTPLHTDPYKKLFHVRENSISLVHSSLDLILSNKSALSRFAICRLGEFLEKHNSSSPRINQKISIAWKRGGRPSIKSYISEILLGFHDPLSCYICGDGISGTPDWDHVIPFSHIGDNDLWNLMPTHGTNSKESRNCNQEKSDRWPTEKEIEKTERRNLQLMKWLDNCGLSKATVRKGVDDLGYAVENNELRRLWFR